MKKLLTISLLISCMLVINAKNALKINMPTDVAEEQSPYGGTAHAIPGTIEIADFDTGGEGVAYHDESAANEGGEYRTEDGVDIVNSGTEGSVYEIGWVQIGEWLEYTVDVAEAGEYSLDILYKAPYSEGSIIVEFDDVSSYTIALPQSDYTTTSAVVNLEAGEQVMKVIINHIDFNLNAITLSPVAAEQSPYGGTAHAIPGTIEIADFDTGGEGVAYHDESAANEGNEYRTEDGVDIVNSGTEGSVYEIGWVQIDEWLEYTVDVAEAGEYTLDILYKAPYSEGSITVEFDDVSSYTIALPQSDYTTTSAVVNLEAGQQIMKVIINARDFNLNAITLSAVAAGQAPYGGPAHAIPGIIEAEDYDIGGEGIAYHDADETNNGNDYGNNFRTDEGVDLEPSGDEGAGYEIGWVDVGEWLEYTVDVAVAGEYTLDVRYKAPYGEGSIIVEFDDVSPDTIALPQSEYTTTSAVVNLEAGEQIMKIIINARDFNLNSISIYKPQTPGPKALRINVPSDNPIKTLATIEESIDAATYRGDTDPSTSMVVGKDGPWTIETWMKTDTILLSTSLFGGGATQFRLTMYGWYEDCQIRCLRPGMNANGRLGSKNKDEYFGSDNETDPTPFIVGQWQHIAIVHDGDKTMSLIINGEEEQILTDRETDDSHITGFDAPAFSIGDNGSNNTYLPNVTIDNYRVWDVARDKASIKANMYEVTPSNVDGLVANYTFDGDNWKIMNSAQDARHMTFVDGVGEYYSYTDDIAPENAVGGEAPVVSNPIADFEFTIGDDAVEFDLTTVFSSDWDDNMTYSVSSTTLTTTDISGNTLSISGHTVGVEEVYVTAIDSLDQTAVDTVKVSVVEDSGMSIANSFGEEVYLNPNPATDYVSIKFTQLKNHVIKIYNITGVEVYSTMVFDEQVRLDLSELSQGIYFFKVGSTSKKLIIRK